MSVYLDLMLLVVVEASGQLRPADMPPGLSVSRPPQTVVSLEYSIKSGINVIIDNDWVCHKKTR